MASELPEKQQRLALRLGILGAYLFRFVALLLVEWIIDNPWIKGIGAAYLIYLMCAHLTGKDRRKAQGLHPKKAGLWMTVFSIELMDLSLSVDNVVAAVALSSKLWIVCTGVFIGILALRLLAGICIKLMERYRILASTAFLLVGYVGALLLAEMIFGQEFGSLVKFAGIVTIVAITLVYERSARLQKLCGPVLKVARVPMRLFSTAVESVFWPLRVLFTFLRNLKNA